MEQKRCLEVERGAAGPLPGAQWMRISATSTICMVSCQLGYSWHNANHVIAPAFLGPLALPTPFPFLAAYGKKRPLSKGERLPWHVIHPDSKLKAFW